MSKKLKFSQLQSQQGDEYSLVTDFASNECQNKKLKIVTFKDDVLYIHFNKKDCPTAVKTLLQKHLQQQSYSTLTIQ